MFYDYIPIEGNKKDFINELIIDGIYKEFTIKNQNIDDFLYDYEVLIKAIGFKIRQRYVSDNFVHHFATWGSESKAWLLKYGLKIGKYTRSGSIQGLESEFICIDDNLFLKIAIVPHLFYNKKEVLLVTQSVLERLTDKEYAREKFDMLLYGFSDYNYEFYEELPENLRWKFPYEFDLETNGYWYKTKTKCPYCEHNYTTFIEIKSAGQETGRTKCHKCYKEFELVITDRLEINY